MMQIALLLFGAEFVRARARHLWIIGLLWGLIGCAVLYDGLDGSPDYPLRALACFLLVESVVTLCVASSGLGAQKAVLFFKGGLFLFIAVIILVDNQFSHLLLAFLFSLTYFIVGLFVAVSAWIVRFPRWGVTLLGGCLYMSFSVFLLMFPHSSVSLFLSGLMIFSGINVIRLAMRAQRLTRATSVFDLMLPTDFYERSTQESARPSDVTVDTAALPADALTIHVWTPEGSAQTDTLRRPVISRYIAAVDTHGHISTGHVALEASPQVYISLYPAQEVDRTPSKFLKLLKATPDNDVPGRFLPNYFTETSDWCEATRSITFNSYNADGLVNYWQRYRQNETYNLTWRNCSSSVAYGLEAALDGVLMERGQRWRSTLKTLLMPELWIAAQVRKRATTMAWTPGLVMDYARALRAIVHPVPLPWYRRMPWARRHATRQAQSSF